jgi:hypothetical protein
MERIVAVDAMCAWTLRTSTRDAGFLVGHDAGASNSPVPGEHTNVSGHARRRRSLVVNRISAQREYS